MIQISPASLQKNLNYDCCMQSFQIWYCCETVDITTTMRPDLPCGGVDEGRQQSKHEADHVIDQTECSTLSLRHTCQRDSVYRNNIIFCKASQIALTLECEEHKDTCTVDPVNQSVTCVSKVCSFNEKTCECVTQGDLDEDVHIRVSHKQHKPEQQSDKYMNSQKFGHRCRDSVRQWGFIKMNSRQNSLWCSLKGFAFFLLLGLLNTPLTTAQGTPPCQFPSRILNISETDPAGTVVFNISIQPDETWSYTFPDNRFNGYFSFAPNAASQLHIMEITKPLDIEEFWNDFNLEVTAIKIDLSCQRPNAQPVTDSSYLVVRAVNEFAPTFNQSSIVLSVNETIPLNSQLIQLIEWASDEDYNSARREISGFQFILPPTVDTQNDATRWIEMTDSYDGVIAVEKGLDFEILPASRKYIVAGLIVTDAGGLTGTTTLTVNVLDDDDLPPEFFHSGCTSPCQVTYSVSIHPNQTGVVTGIQPGPVQARDGDALNYDITYHLVQGPDGYETYLAMDQTTGQLTVLKELMDLQVGSFVMIIEAREVSALQRSTRTTFLINIDGAAVGGSVAKAGSDDDILIVAIVLAVVVFIIVVILVIGMIYFRKKFKKAVHPDSNGPIIREEANTTQATPDIHSSRDQRRTLDLSDDMQFMRGEEEMTAWVPVTSSKDIVDLSDEDTLRLKKKNGVPPNSTTLNNRDSAYEGSEKKSSSEGSHKDNDFSVESDYAELDTLDIPPKKRLSNNPTSNNIPDKNGILADRRAVNNVYGDSPSNTPLSAAPPPPGRSTKSHDDNFDNTYLTPKETSSKPPFTPSVFINKAYRDDDEKTTSFSSRKPDKARIDNMERVQRNPLYGEDDDELTEYSVPPSSRSNYANRPLPIPDDVRKSKIHELGDEDQRPDVPPRHRLRPISGVKLPPDGYEDDEDPYAKVDKKRSPSQSDPVDADQSSSADNSPNMTVGSIPLQAPSRKKRPKKRFKSPLSPEENVYDGTKDYEDLEVDSGFYTDTNKSRIKRSTRLPVMKPDPNDTRYWITVTNEY